MPRQQQERKVEKYHKLLRSAQGPQLLRDICQLTTEEKQKPA